MTDIIERAEAALEVWPERVPHDAPFLTMIRELVAELKAARAENERLREQASGAVVSGFIAGMGHPVQND